MERLMIGFCGLAATTLSILPAAGAEMADSGWSPPAMHCADLVGLHLAGSTLKVAKATAVPESPPNTVQYMPPFPMKVRVEIPPYCRAEGDFEERVGFGGVHYAIGFAVALPDRWNGRFLFQGGGGFNGSVLPPLGTAAAGNTPALARGFAVVSTDSGHKGAVFDPAFFKDQEAALNFANASVGKVTTVAKAIIEHYYGRPAAHSYFAGCSTGGREGMEAAERLPEEYDGIVVGDPAMDVGFSSIGLVWFNHVMTGIAPTDSSGTPQPDKVFSGRDRKLVVDAIMKACDALDGLKDGMIFNAGQCHFDPKVLQCTGPKTESCLSATQVDALKTAFAGPKDSRGRQVYPGFPWDSDIAAEGVRPGILTSGGTSPVGPRYHRTIDVDGTVARVEADGVQQLTDTVNWTNLNSFFARGGKILYFHGTSDPWFSALSTLEYYQRMANASGGMERVRAQSARFFFVPGMEHCRAGPAALDSFDLLGAVVNWVEHGKAPDYVIATGTAFPGRSRPLCAWPEHAQYTGHGNPEDAMNFACAE
jgi:pimeloyl-ACP methyl ester carboxylesterase